MRARLLFGISLAVCMIAACGGSVTSPGGGGPGDDDGVGTDDGGTSIGVGEADAGVFIDDGGVTAYADAAFGGDGGGHHHRDGGVGFFDGGVGGFDGGIFVEDSGTSFPPPEDDGGSVGPRDASLSGPLLRDANGVVLGEIISIQSEGAVFTVVTPNDYVVDINYDGTYTVTAETFFYSGINCTGAVSLEADTTPTELLGSKVIYSSYLGSLLIAAGPLSDGAETSVLLTSASAGNPCENGNPNAGPTPPFYSWPLVETTAANVGLPDVIAAPLSYP